MSHLLFFFFLFMPKEKLSEPPEDFVKSQGIIKVALLRVLYRSYDCPANCFEKYLFFSTHIFGDKRSHCKQAIPFVSLYILPLEPISHSQTTH